MNKADKFKLKASYLAGILIFYYFLMPDILGSIFGAEVRFVAEIIKLVVTFLIILFIIGLFIKTRNLYIFVYTGVIWLILVLVGELLDFKWAAVFTAFFLFMLLKNLLDLDKGRNLLYRRYIRALLELAAAPVDDVADGYTNRPFPVGTHTFSKKELTGFAKYLRYKLVAASYFQEDKVILVFSTGFFRYIPLLKPNFSKVTYAAFDFQGNVSVNIAKKDYHQYKEELTFDQLCNSLGNIVMGLLSDYQKGERKQIIKRLDNVKLPQPDLFVRKKPVLNNAKDKQRSII